MNSRPSAPHVDARTTPPAVASVTEEPPKAPDTANAVYALGSERRLVLPGGVVVEARGGLLTFRAADSSWEVDSYIEADEAELIHETWLVWRDRLGRASIRTASREPLTAAPGKPIAMRIGDRIKIGDWVVTWAGVLPGSLDATGARVEEFHASYKEQATNAWQLAAKQRRAHDFTTDSGLQRLELVVESSALELDVSSARVVVRTREVDHAKKAAFGSNLTPGLYAFQDGLRFSFERGQKLCAISKSGCTCSEILLGTAAFNGSEELISLAGGNPTTELSHTFRVLRDHVVVTKAP